MTTSAHAEIDAPGAIDYEESKRLARDADPEVRRRLARRHDVRPEILYFLAEDREPAVRREIAGNTAAPRQADLLLAADSNVEVRHALACKIAEIAPTLSREQRARVRRLTEQVLDRLARDQALRVRRVVAEALKDLTDAPSDVIQRLARDAELAVAGPILERSPLLFSEDLLDIIASGPIHGALTAIARRAGLPVEVTDAIVGAAVNAPEEASAITALLANDSAQIREETLDRIVDRAPAVESWHEPLVRRPALPPKAVRRLAEFVSRSLLDLLQRRPDLDPDTAREVAATVRRRLEEEEAAPSTSAPASTTDEPIEAGLGRGDYRAVAAALARDSGLDRTVVDRILSSRSPKSVVALAWKAGLSARLALQLQLRIAGIPARNALNPREGVFYPLTEEEMAWQIGFFSES